MARNRNRMEVQLADSETSLLSLIRTEVQEPPAPSISLQRSLREIPLRQPRDKQRQRAWARAHMGLGALAAAIALLLLAAPPDRPHRVPEASPFEQLSGQWNYELFAPQEFEPLDPVYHSEFSLPPGYDALDYWVY